MRLVDGWIGERLVGPSIVIDIVINMDMVMDSDDDTTCD
jgi:hypothetical protein